MTKKEQCECTHNMNTPHFNAGRYIFLYVHSTQTTNSIENIYMRVRKTEIEQVCVYIEMRPIYLLCTTDEKQQKNSHTHTHITSPIYNIRCILCAATCAHTKHTHTFTHITFLICNKTTTPAFWVFVFLIHIIFIRFECVCAIFSSWNLLPSQFIVYTSNFWHFWSQLRVYSFTLSLHFYVIYLNVG